MGSTGSVVFCGNKKYQLIGSKYYDNSNRNDNDWFYSVRRHPLSLHERKHVNIVV